MYLMRIFKTLPRCSRLVNHFDVFGRERIKSFAVQRSWNYCSISAANGQVSTSENPGPASLENVSVDSLVQTIKSDIKLKHGPKYDYSFHDLNNVIEYLLKYEDVTHEQLLKLFSKHPTLGQHYRRSWECAFGVLSGNGLPISDILRMLSFCPQLLRRNPAEMDETFICLREYKFGDVRLLTLLRKAPELLLTEAKFISQQINELMTLFTHKDILKLVVNSPRVLLEDFEDTKEKVVYITCTIGVQQMHIVSNNALSHSLSHIRFRHALMSRTGIYRKNHPKKEIANPNLSNMLSTPIKLFAESICGITVEEYEVFHEMFERENSQRDGSDSSTDSDSESEDDES